MILRIPAFTLAFSQMRWTDLLVSGFLESEPLRDERSQFSLRQQAPEVGEDAE